MKTAIRKNREPDTYFSLIRKFPLKPLRTEAEYDEAVAIMERLAVRGENGLDSGERPETSRGTAEGLADQARERYNPAVL